MWGSLCLLVYCGHFKQQAKIELGEGLPKLQSLHIDDNMTMWNATKERKCARKIFGLEKGRSKYYGKCRPLLVSSTIQPS
jgi:hypothetical protein